MFISPLASGKPDEGVQISTNRQTNKARANVAFRFLDHLDDYPKVIARQDIEKYFSWLPAKTLSHLEACGNGPEGAFYVGKKKLYPTAEFLAWLDSRSTTTKPRGTTPVKKKTKSRLGRKTKAQERRERLGGIND